MGTEELLEMTDCARMSNVGKDRDVGVTTVLDVEVHDTCKVLDTGQRLGMNINPVVNGHAICLLLLLHITELFRRWNDTDILVVIVILIIIHVVIQNHRF